MKTITTIASTLILLVLIAMNAQAGKKEIRPGFAWANGTLYGTESATRYEPATGARNTLLVFTGLKGQRAVAEAGPGDVNYHGGKWQVVILEFTPEGKAAFDVNGDSYSEFEITTWDMAHHYMNDHNFFKVVGQGSAFDSPLVRPKGLEPPDKQAKAEKAAAK